MKERYNNMENKETNKDEQVAGGPMWPGRCWSDILADIALDRWINGVIAYRRLVDTGLYTHAEYKELCDFTYFLGMGCDYKGRFKWCKNHNMIELRGRNAFSQWFYDSPVDHIITVYGTNELNVKGYKGKKHVLELHFSNLNSWEDYKREVLDKYHLMDMNPDFIGRRDPIKGISWIGDSDFDGDYVTKWILEDEPIEKLQANEKAFTYTGTGTFIK